MIAVVSKDGGAFGGLLFLLLGVLAIVTAITGGAVALQPSGRFDVAVAGLGVVTAYGICSGRVRVRWDGLSWAGVALLAAFSFWSALSIYWSVYPEASWIAADRAFAYAVVAAAALVAASATSRAAERTAVGLLVLGVTVAAYALAGKLTPGIHLKAFDLDPGGRFPRISRPLDYWNALALICVMAASSAIWIGASRNFTRRIRSTAALSLGLLLLTVALTYSRGAILGITASLVVLVGAGPNRLTRLLLTIGSMAAIAPAVIVAFTRHDLSTSGVALSERIDGGLILLAVLSICLGAIVLAMRQVYRLESRIRHDPALIRRTWWILGGFATTAAVIGVVAVALSPRGLTGEISSQINNFKTPSSSISNDPDRLISINSSSRYAWWSEALGAFSDRPLIGQGAGSFPVLHYLYRDYPAPVRSSHSLPLMFLSETGLVGFALGMGALLLLGLAAVRRIRAADEIERTARLALLTAATAWFVQSLFDWHWEIPGVTVPALIGLCVAGAPPRCPSDELGSAADTIASTSFRRSALALLATVAALAFAASAYLPGLSEQKRLHALELADSDPRAALHEAHLASHLDPLSIDALFVASSIGFRINDPRQAIEPLIRATEVEPDSYEAWRRLRGAYLVFGYPVQAAEALPHVEATNRLDFHETDAISGAAIFSSLAPPRMSPTAFGTPPPDSPG